MTLQAARELLKNINKDSVLLVQSSSEHVGMTTLLNIIKFNSFLEQIKDINAFSPLLDYFKSSQISKVIEDKAVLSTKTVNDYMTRQSLLWERIEMFLLVAEQFAPTVRENTLSIKLSNNKNFVDIAKDISQIEKYISQIICNNDIQGHAEIDSFEHGSLWINIYVGSMMAVSIIGSTLWAAAVINNKITQDKILEEVFRGKKLANDHIEALVKASEEELKGMLELEATHIYKQYHKKETDKDIDFEQIERIKKSIEVLSELIRKGTEVYPALLEPEKVSNLFPDFKALETITSQVKQIENKSK